MNKFKYLLPLPFAVLLLPGGTASVS